MSNGEQWEITILGKTLTATQAGIYVTVASTIIGMLWTVFQVWHKIDNVPDMGEFEKRLALVEETSNKTNDYTRDIKNDIKNDIRKLEKVVEQVERDSKDSARYMDRELRAQKERTEKLVKEALDNPMNGK